MCQRGEAPSRYDADCFLSVHTDKPDKIATHIIYLNDVWSQSWGGCLHLHDDSESKVVCRTVNPVIDNAILFARSERSWHSVGPVVRGDRHRDALQVVFWR